MPSIYEKIIHKHPESYTAQLITLDAHCSNLNARLVATLDALDNLQRDHHSEVEQLSQRVNALHARSRILKTRAKLAEAERDALKEGVDRLLEKEPLATGSRLASGRIHSPDCQDALVNSLITTLTIQLTTSHAEFTELKRSSDARIAILEAQVARREAELQAYRPCPCSCHPHGPPELDVSRLSLGSSTKHMSQETASQPTEQRILAPFSKDQAVKILHETTLRHRVLQVEVEGLARKLDLAQSQANQERTKYTISTAETPSQAQEEFARLDIAVNPSSYPQAIVPPSKAISSIDRQLSNVEQDVNDLRAERDNITAALNEDNRLKGILLIEEECVRLRRSERALRQQLLLASTTKQDLKALVEKLQRKTAFRPDDSEARDEGELDMELDNGTDEINLSTTEDDTPRPLPHAASTVTPSVPESVSQEKPPPDTASMQAVRLARIESDLEIARADVESKEHGIESLKAQLAVLEQAIALQPRGRSSIR